MRCVPFALVALALTSACRRHVDAPVDAPVAIERPAVVAVERRALVTIDRRALAAAALAPIGAELPSPANPSTPAKVALGRTLFSDPRLSVDGTVSCASCHDLERYGTDGRATSRGHDGRSGRRNSPSVYNAAGHFAQFWDARAVDVEAQALGPITNPIEMGMADSAALERRLRAIPSYAAAFRAAFPGDPRPLRADNVARALGAFERRLTTPSRFDRFLAGEEHALGHDETEGLRRFVALGCATCHGGSGIGGGSLQKLGLVAAWTDERDLGRFEITHDEADRMRFRVPSLRNVAETAPYFHDGSVPDLRTAVRLMARHQLGRELGDEDVRTLVAFLRSLTGTLPAVRASGS